MTSASPDTMRGEGEAARPGGAQLPAASTTTTPAEASPPNPLLVAARHADIVGVDLPRDVWLAERRKGVGASDSAAVLGLSPWSNPMMVWLDKVGLGEEVRENEAMFWGNILEDPVARVTAEREGVMILDTGKVLLRSKDWPWLMATPDRIGTWQGEWCGMEIKTTGEHMRTEWDGDELPAPALVQAHHCMVVTGIRRWLVSGLVGGNKYRPQWVLWDQSMANLIVERTGEFWEHVEKGDPPPVDGSELTTKALQKLYPAITAKTAELDADDVELLAELRRLKVEEKEITARRKLAANQIRARLRDAEVGTHNGRVVVTWRQQDTYQRFSVTTHEAQEPECHARYMRSAPGIRPLLPKKEK